jgi:EAL domain-containing protein (putative c-di-GMP-specific phosphodiesterase class I)
VATWDGAESATDLVARVDDALYEGKRHKRPEDKRIYVARTALAMGGSPSWADRVPRLVESQGIVSLYQPIVDLSDRSIFGHEALARPADDPGCESVAEMFDTGRRMGFLRDLDWICRRAAMEGGSAVTRSKPLFINVSLESLLDPVHDVDQMLMLTQWASRVPARIVLEITQGGDDAGDLARLVEVVASYRHAGFRFALDNVGDGHSTIELLLAVNPEFIKVAPALIGAAPGRPGRSAIEGMMAFAAAQGTTVLAQGIETEIQLAGLRDLGVTIGQG